MIRTALSALLCWGLLGCGVAHARPIRGVEFGVTSGMEKLRPGTSFPRERVIELTAARGECESAQIAVRSRKGFEALSAEASPLGSSPSIEVTLYRVAMLDLPRPSGPDGKGGAWPDPLVPVRDPYFKEARQAFPVKVSPGQVISGRPTQSASLAVVWAL